LTVASRFDDAWSPRIVDLSLFTRARWEAERRPGPGWDIKIYHGFKCGALDSWTKLRKESRARSNKMLDFCGFKGLVVPNNCALLVGLSNGAPRHCSWLWSKCAGCETGKGEAMLAGDGEDCVKIWDKDRDQVSRASLKVAAPQKKLRPSRPSPFFKGVDKDREAPLFIYLQFPYLFL